MMKFASILLTVLLSITLSGIGLSGKRSERSDGRDYRKSCPKIGAGSERLPFSHPVTSDRMKMMGVFVNQGNDPDVGLSDDGSTTLHLLSRSADIKGDEIIGKFLLDNFVDPLSRNNAGQTPKEVAVQMKKDQKYINLLTTYENAWKNPIAAIKVDWLNVTFLPDYPESVSRKIKIKASTTFPDADGKSYKIENIIDMNPETAWIEGKKGYGRGEWFEFKVPKDLKKMSIYLLNGCTKSKRLWLDNSRIKSLGIFHNRILIAFVNLEDTPQWQKADMSPVLKKTDIRKNDTLRFKIKDVYKGDKYRNTALSELFISEYQLMT